MGQPWFVGDAAYYLCHGKARAAPRSAKRKNAALEHFETLLEIYGTGRGLRHARKHLGWALNAAAETAGASESVLKAHRERVLTADEPVLVHRHLAEAYRAFGGTARMAA